MCQVCAFYYTGTLTIIGDIIVLYDMLPDKITKQGIIKLQKHDKNKLMQPLKHSAVWVRCDTNCSGVPKNIGYNLRNRIEVK